METSIRLLLINVLILSLTCHFIGTVSSASLFGIDFDASKNFNSIQVEKTREYTHMNLFAIKNSDGTHNQASVTPKIRDSSYPWPLVSKTNEKSAQGPVSVRNRRFDNEADARPTTTTTYETSVNSMVLATIVGGHLTT